MNFLSTLLLTIWAGSLWTVCGIVAPTLFAVLDDRHAAGQVAATLFTIETYIGVAIGALLLALSFAGKLSLPSGSGRALVIVTAISPLLSEIALVPMMESARVAGDMARFGVLHAVSGVLFLVACSSALLLVWKFSRQAG